MPPRGAVREARAGVLLENRRVGALGYHDGNTWFDYEDREADHPVLGLAFEAEPEPRRTASGRVPEWFANLLPEDGSALRELIARDLATKRVHDFTLLVHLGEDLPGAVRVVAESDLDAVEELAEPEHRPHDHPLRFSLAGMQAKFSMRFSGKALVIPATGQGGDWIVKLHDQRSPEVPENERAMLTWARLAGLDVPEHKLVQEGDLQGLPRGVAEPDLSALAVRRFDRVVAARVHQEDFAQVREVAPDIKDHRRRASYGGLARVLSAVCPRDVDEYVRRLVAAVVMGNTDAHLKNWTLRYPDGRSPRLAPAYDLLCVTGYPQFRDDRLVFALGGETRPQLIRRKHFQRLGDEAALDSDSVVSTVEQTVDALRDTWPAVERECPVPELVARHVRERLTTLPLVSGQ